MSMSRPVLGRTETVLAVLAVRRRWPLLPFRSWRLLRVRPVMLMDDLVHPSSSSGSSRRMPITAPTTTPTIS